MAKLAKKDTTTIGPPPRGGARHDIMLPGHQRTNIITLGKLSLPSYLTEIQIRLVSWYLKLTMLEEKRCDTNWRDDIEDSREMNHGSQFRNKSSSVNQWEDEEVAGGISDNSSRLTKDGFPQLCEQRDNICQIKWYNDVCLRKTYTIKHWLKGAPEIWVGLHNQRRNGDSIIKTKNERPTINFKAIGLLEGKNPNNTVHLLESTRGPRKNGDGEKYHYTKNS